MSNVRSRRTRSAQLQLSIPLDPSPIGDPPRKLLFVGSFWHWGLGRRLRARDFGLVAFPIWVRTDRVRRIPPDQVASIKTRKRSKR